MRDDRVEHVQSEEDWRLDNRTHRGRKPVVGAARQRAAFSCGAPGRAHPLRGGSPLRA